MLICNSIMVYFFIKKKYYFEFLIANNFFKLFNFLQIQTKLHITATKTNTIIISIIVFYYYYKLLKLLLTKR